jgi:hypothetical protein
MFEYTPQLNIRCRLTMVLVIGGRRFLISHIQAIREIVFCRRWQIIVEEYAGSLRILRRMACS